MSKYDNYSDEELVETIRNQDKEVYIEIVRRYENKLLRYAGYLTGNEHQAADVVQEAFIKAFVNLNGFNIKRKFSSWIYRIVHNQAINAIRKNGKEVHLNEKLEIADSGNVEEEMQQKEIVQKAHLCLKKIPVIYAEPLALFYLDEKSYEEISDILKLPMGTVATRISRAKTIMKTVCQKKE